MSKSIFRKTADVFQDIATITASLLNKAGINVSNAWGKAQAPAWFAPAYAANIDWNAGIYQAAFALLSGNTTFNSPTNILPLATYILWVQQDAVGGRTAAFGSTFKFSNGTAPSLTNTPNGTDIFTFVASGSGLLYCVGQSKDIK